MPAKESYIQSIVIDWSRIDSRSYLRRIDALKEMRRLAFSAPVTFFVGENGSGKSTLLEAMAIAYGFNAEGGTRNYSFSTYNSSSELFGALRLIRSPRKAEWGYFLRAETFYNVATKEMEYTEEEGVPLRLHERSHGESFLKIAQTQFKPGGVYFLDEPEAALSPQRQLTLFIEIHECALSGSQFFIATHSPILLGMPDAQILSFESGGVRPCEYEDTSSYQVTALFINQRARMLKQLLKTEMPDE